MSETKEQLEELLERLDELRSDLSSLEGDLYDLQNHIEDELKVDKEKDKAALKRWTEGALAWA